MRENKYVSLGPVTMFILTSIFVTTSVPWIKDYYEEPETTKWEYKIESMEDKYLTFTMNDLGGHGWEAASCRRATSDEAPLYECIFKRIMR